jgi:two-component system chemotaxis response regulator CheB
MNPIRVLVVDDSALMRRLVRTIVERTSTLTFVGQAGSGEEALRQIAALDPDVVTLDVDMPGMTGLAVLERVMRERPRPVVMLSYLTQAGGEAAMRALALGAVDVVAKPSGAISVNLVDVAVELVRKIGVAANARVHPTALAPIAARVRPPDTVRRALRRVVVIGSSTGGPQALEVVVPALPQRPDTGYLLVQHMPGWLTPWLVERLDRLHPSLDVRQAREGDHLEVGVMLVAPGDRHLRIGPNGVVMLDDGPKVNSVRPSVDVTLNSVVMAYGGNVVAVILTGIGKDGADGAASVRRAGGSVLVEDRSTCVVWGMPRAVEELGLASRVVPLGNVGAALAAAFGQSVLV